MHRFGVRKWRTSLRTCLMGNLIMKNETYLGDGLYASFDGWHIFLRAPRENGDHFVGLEPQVFKNLLEWYRKECVMSEIIKGFQT